MLQLLAVLSAVVAGGGCASRPASAPWSPDQAVIRAQAAPAEGFLVVETQEVGSPQDGEQPHQRFYVYEETGRYLDYYPNDHFLPISLPVGRYVVVSRYSRRNKRVQIEIEKGQTTTIRLRDFEKAPAME
jgi:hypothetical protein